MSNINYGSFNPNKFNQFTSRFHREISNNMELNKDQKIELGKNLFEFFGRDQVFQTFVGQSTSLSQDENYVDIANQYIELKRKIHAAQSKNDQSDTNLKLNETVENFLDSWEAGDKNTSELFIKQFSEPLISDAPKTIEENPKEEINSKVQTLFHDVHSQPELKYTNAKISLIENLFHINIVPQVSNSNVYIGRTLMSPASVQHILRENNQLKKEFLQLHLPSNRMTAINAQAWKFPIMQSAVDEIRKNLEIWDELALRNDQTALDILKIRLENQFTNLVLISNLISNVTVNLDDEQALMTLPLSEFSKGINGWQEVDSTLKLAIDNAIKGNVILNDKLLTGNYNLLAGILKRSIKVHKENSPPPSTIKMLQKERNLNPVTVRAIQLQAELHQAIRKGKAWAMEQSSLIPEGTSANLVFKLKTHPNLISDTERSLSSHPEEETVAFFKIGEAGEAATGMMETLMWDMAVIFGLEDLFVPTGETQIKDINLINQDGETTGNQITVKEAPKPLKGGIQPAQIGQTLLSTLESGEQIESLLSTDEVTRGILASLVFGMFDAHSNNIFITQDGKIKFFDNTRSFPNNNGFLKWGDLIMNSYQCGLLDLPQSEIKLTDDQIDQIKIAVRSYKEKIEKLKLFLHSKHIQARLAKLPPGWLDVEAAISATEERLNLMEKALNNNVVDTLQDLAVSCNPQYKLAYSLGFIGNIYLHQSFNTEGLHDRINLNSIKKTLLTIILQSKIDIELIIKWCNDPQISCKDLERNIKEHIKNTVLNPPSDETLKNWKNAGMLLLAKILKSSNLDLKDIDRSDCEQIVLNYNLDLLKNQGIQNVKSMLGLDASVMGSTDPILIIVQDERQQVIFLKNAEFSIKEIDLKSKPGKIFVDGKELSIDQLKEHLFGST